ncbi:MAG TPA: hypothetical protein VIA62_12965 [Thermoanaerobaculia bacterium]|jgi:hypothetical protein|nr:hypothetical protein [Thermoanaerobaculia bacterium]
MSLTRDRRYQKGNCFVLMPYGVKELPNGQKFDWDEHWTEVLEVAIKQAGMTPVRADNMAGPGLIMDRLWQGIQEAEVVVADLTGLNPNVLYEFGLAHAVNKRILILSMFPNDTPVDLQQFVQIPYTANTLQLAKNLATNLDAARKLQPNEMKLVPIDVVELVRSAKVLSVMPDFAMIKADTGRVGVLSAEDFAWTRIPDLTRALQIGRDLKNGAFVVDANGQQKFSLIHDENENPWLKLAKEFPLNSEFRSVVGNVKDGTGAWVRMNYGIDGFIPQRQLPRGVVAGIDIEAQVMEINQAKRQVSLQFVKIPSGPPPKDQAWPFRRGQVCEGYIVKTAPDRGFALVKIEHENQPITGLLHNTNMSPALRDRLFNQELRVGDPVRVEIVHFDPIKPSIKFRERPSDTAAPVSETELVEAY